MHFKVIKRRGILRPTSRNAEQANCGQTDKEEAQGRAASRHGGRFNLVVLTLFVLVIAFIVVYFYPHLFVTIHAGERGVMWSRWTGTEMDSIYMEGTQFVWPWNKLTVYDVRYKLATKDVNFLTKDGLTVSMQLKVRYRPADRMLTSLHETVGPNYADVVVLPEVVKGLREVISQYKLEELYSSQFQDIQKKMLTDSRIEAGKRFVIMDDVIFDDIRMPEAISQAILRKLEQEQSAKQMEYVLDTARQEANRKVIEAKGIKEQQRLINDTLTDRMLKYKSIEAVRDLAASPNAKIVVMGSNGNGMDSNRLLLNLGDQPQPAKKP
jgi:regulator of protease activity HflC (stomatin/prohibitin superfamily)